VTQEVRNAGQFAGVKFVSRPSRVQGAHLEASKANRFLVMQGVQLHDGTAAGNYHVQVVETDTILADQVAEPIHADVSGAARARDPFRVHAGVYQGHSVVKVCFTSSTASPGPDNRLAT
jgi:hypothetical protein